MENNRAKEIGRKWADALYPLIGPVIFFGFGYVGGLILKLVFGGLVVYGLNSIFRTDYFETDMIPAIVATLSLCKYFVRKHAK